MTSQFSPKISEILAFSREEAARLTSGFVGPEHLLLGMLREKEGPVTDLFERLAISVPNIKYQLEERLRDSQRPMNVQTRDILLNDHASNILKLAVIEARILHTQTVDVQHLLLAILHDNLDNGAKEVLEENNLTYEKMFQLLQKKPMTDGLDLPDEDEEDFEDSNMESQQSGYKRHTTATAQPHGKSGTPVLDNFSTDLTLAATQGKLDPVVGREKEIQRVIEILCRRKKNNPILIGEPGVGKSAIV